MYIKLRFYSFSCFWRRNQPCGRLSKSTLTESLDKFLIIYLIFDTSQRGFFFMQSGNPLSSRNRCKYFNGMSSTSNRRDIQSKVHHNKEIFNRSFNKVKRYSIKSSTNERDFSFFPTLNCE